MTANTDRVWSDRWYVEVVVAIAGRQHRRCAIGPLGAWKPAHRLATAWEREFGPGTTKLWERMPAWARSQHGAVRGVSRRTVELRPDEKPTYSPAWRHRGGVRRSRAASR